MLCFQNEINCVQVVIRITNRSVAGIKHTIKCGSWAVQQKKFLTRMPMGNGFSSFSVQEHNQQNWSWHLLPARCQPVGQDVTALRRPQGCSCFL